MGVNSPKLNLLTTNKGIRFMLALESHRAFYIPPPKDRFSQFLSTGVQWDGRLMLGLKL